MKKIYIATSLFLLGITSAFAQNLQFRSNLTYPYSLANIGGYADTAGNEYALVGTQQGLSIVNVTDPANPFIRFSVPGARSDWREVKTYKNYAYVTTEGGGGLTVIDMSQLPDTILYYDYTGDGAISGQLNTIHALHCDTTKGYLYLYGSNINGGHSLFFDLNQDPYNPVYAGSYTYPGGGNAAYVHDGYADNDTLYEGHIYSGFYTVIDVRDKSNPVLIATQATPGVFTHNTWLSNDHKTLFTTDEVSNSVLAAYDITDFSNIKELSRFQTDPGSNSIIHNVHILNDFAIISWYTQGVVIVDVSRPANPIEVGKYDTYPASDGDGFNGCWGVYPFLPSGTIVASDINNGLFVLSPSYIRGCYLEGIVSDSITGFPLNGALVEILSTSITKNSNLSGEYKTGLASAGTYSIRVSKAGYITKTITNVVLANGVLTPLDIQMAPVQAYTYSGLVTDSATGLPVPNAIVSIVGNGLSYRSTANSNGTFSITGVPDSYTLYAGKWGYRTVCTNVNVQQGSTLNVSIAQGFYDDFTFDYGWTVGGSSANSWTRGEPFGTTDNQGTQIAPEFDINLDCGDSCFVTDNGGLPYNNHDVDNGNTILTSPAFDATIYRDPSISYHRWYVNTAGVGAPNDTMKISLTDGSSTVLVDQVLPGNLTGWINHSFRIADYLTPSASMRLIVQVSDNAPGNITEGAIDLFQVTGLITTDITEENQSSVGVYPNPFNESFTVNLFDSKVDVIKLIDLTGREVYRSLVSGNSISIQLNLLPGIYILKGEMKGKSVFQSKLVKE